MKIAIVTFEFEGLTINGGIGTAYRRMAEMLAKQGHKVTVVFIPFDWNESFKKVKQDLPKNLSTFENLGIEIEYLLNPLFHTAHNWTHDERSMQVYRYLKQTPFDVIHFPDNCGLLYYSLLAKKSNLEFQKSIFVAGAHGSVHWTNTIDNNYSLNSILLAEWDRRSIEMADALVSPSAYMLDFIDSEKWRTPPHSVVIPNVNYLSRRKRYRNRKTLKNPSNGLIYFGRFEPRKGIFSFVESLKILLDKNIDIGAQTRLPVYFLGSARPPWHNSVAYIKGELAAYQKRIDLQFVLELSSERSLEFIASRPRHLVCMPSLADNSPYVTLECVERGFRFLTTDRGGQRELIDSADHHFTLAGPEPERFAQGIERHLKQSFRNVAPSKLALQANKRWTEFHKQLLRRHLQINAVKSATPSELVSIVCGAPPSDSSLNLFQTLLSIAIQDYPHIEICLSSNVDISHIPGKAGLRIKKFNQPLSSTSWREVARQATGKYILFLDQAKLADPAAISEMVRVAENQSNSKERIFAVNGIIEEELRGKKHLKMPYPDDIMHLMLLPSSGNSHLLWNRKELIKIDKKWAANVLSDTDMYPLFSGALARGGRVVPIPKVVIERPFQASKSDYEASYARFNALKPQIGSFSKSKSRQMYALLAIYNDSNYLRKINHELTSKLLQRAPQTII
ncbi:MAG: glycosyltransferase [Oligoflexia bacterium]|nr:glycosyltransferase [Oligoflexia bacterium]